MAKLSRDAVLKLAQLSRLKLSEEEVEKFRLELAEILEYVKQLEDAEVEGLDPTYQVTGLKSVMREDEAIEYQASPESLLKNAPAVEKNQFKVKRVLG